MSPSTHPTDYGIRPEDSRLGHRAAVGLTAVFLLAIALPGLLREFSADSIRGAVATIAHWHDGTVVDRLRAVEKRVDDGAWTKPIRQRVQTVLYQVFREGNRKVLVGRDGWLFHRPGIRALTGRGPVLGPTHSVAKDHSLKNWEGPIPVIEAFAAQLKERGIDLVLVPVPDKARGQQYHYMAPAISGDSINWRSLFCRPSLPGGAEWLAHPSEAELVQQLKARGVRVKAPWFSLIGDEEPVFEVGRGDHRRTDTHPTAHRLALEAWSVLREQMEPGWKEFAISYTYPLEGSKRVQIKGQGDLARMLDLIPSSGTDFEEQFEAEPAPLAHSDPTSPVVLLGDSNVNMYDDPGLPFYMPGAGFGSWLSAYLGKPLHIIAINGGGATAVRRQFAALPDDVVRAKKVVIWVIAERDLFMDPAVAKENGVEWKRVTFNPNSSQPAATVPGDALVVDVTMKTKSALQDLAQANYPDAVYVAECAVDEVVAGTYAPAELAVVLWNFRHREVQPSAGYAPGQKLRLNLVPWDSKGELTKTNLSNDSLRFDLPLLYAEKIEPR